MKSRKRIAIVVSIIIVAALCYFYVPYSPLIVLGSLPVLAVAYTGFDWLRSKKRARDKPARKRKAKRARSQMHSSSSADPSPIVSPIGAGLFGALIAFVLSLLILRLTSYSSSEIVGASGFIALLIGLYRFFSYRTLEAQRDARNHATALQYYRDHKERRSVNQRAGHNLQLESGPIWKAISSVLWIGALILCLSAGAGHMALLVVGLWFFFNRHIFDQN